MSAVEVAAAIIGTIIAAVGLAFVLIELRTAGRGRFLIERNRELSEAYDQVISQLNNDRDECNRKLAENRDALNELRGEIAVLHRDRAERFAAQVLEALDGSSVWRVERDRGRPTRT